LKEDDVLTVGFNRAMALLADKPHRPAPKALGNHPADGKPVTLRSGRFGPYVQHGKLMATLPKSLDAASVTLDQAVEVLAAKAARAAGGNGAAKPAARGGRRKAAAGD
jgi:DNA topoisomerase-1